MAVPDSTEPGIYECITRSGRDVHTYRRWENNEWHDAVRDLQRAITAGQGFDQDYYERKVEKAWSVELVADLRGNPIQHGPTQLDLFQ